MQVKGVRVTMSQLVKQWLSRSLKILQGLFSSDAYGNLLREAEQFLWAGSEMDAVRFESSTVSLLFYALQFAFCNNNLLSKKKIVLFLI